LPFVILAASGMASVNKGGPKFYWYSIAGVAVLVSGFVTVARDRQNGTLREQAVKAKTALAMALSGAGQPLIAALSEVTAADTLATTQSAMRTLINRVVGVAQEESGAYGEDECHTRAALYQFVGDDLELTYNEGRHGDRPRRYFRAAGPAHDVEAIRVANGDNGLVVDDLENNPPPHFIDPRGRNYKSFIAVPVRVHGKSFGMLVVDSDKPFSLGNVDRGYLVLLSGILATGLAHLECVERLPCFPAP
jgi:hypothetical protein